MTNKEQIICKYKFQDKEKFDGKPYCTCFNELCKNLSFVCDHNCQIYEDFKQLARKTQECEKLKEQLMETKTFDLFADKLIEKFNTDSAIASIFKDNIRYRKALEEIEGIVKNFGSYAAWQEQRINKILDIINKAKGR